MPSLRTKVSPQTVKLCSEMSKGQLEWNLRQSLTSSIWSSLRVTKQEANLLTSLLSWMRDQTKVKEAPLLWITHYTANRSLWFLDHLTTKEKDPSNPWTPRITAEVSWIHFKDQDFLTQHLKKIPILLSFCYLTKSMTQATTVMGLPTTWHPWTLSRVLAQICPRNATCWGTT